MSLVCHKIIFEITTQIVHGVGPSAGRNLRQNIHRKVLNKQTSNAGLCVWLLRCLLMTKGTCTRPKCILAGICMVLSMCQVKHFYFSTCALKSGKQYSAVDCLNFSLMSHQPYRQPAEQLQMSFYSTFWLVRKMSKMLQCFV